MKHCSEPCASATQTSAHTLALVGYWTARGLGDIAPSLAALRCDAGTLTQIDAAGIIQLDTVGAWVLNKLLNRLRAEGLQAALLGLNPDFARLMEAVIQHEQAQARAAVAPAARPQPLLECVGRRAGSAWERMFAMLGFVGECAQAFAGCLIHPSRMRWRPILFNIRRGVMHCPS